MASKEIHDSGNSNKDTLDVELDKKTSEELSSDEETIITHDSSDGTRKKSSREKMSNVIKDTAPIKESFIARRRRLLSERIKNREEASPSRDDVQRMAVPKSNLRTDSFVRADFRNIWLHNRPTLRRQEIPKKQLSALNTSIDVGCRKESFLDKRRRLALESAKRKKAVLYMNESVSELRPPIESNNPNFYFPKNPRYCMKHVSRRTDSGKPAVGSRKIPFYARMSRYGDTDFDRAAGHTKESYIASRAGFPNLTYRAHLGITTSSKDVNNYPTYADIASGRKCVASQTDDPHNLIKTNISDPGIVAITTNSFENSAVDFDTNSSYSYSSASVVTVIETGVKFDNVARDFDVEKDISVSNDNLDEPSSSADISIENSLGTLIDILKHIGEAESSTSFNFDREMFVCNTIFSEFQENFADIFERWDNPDLSFDVDSEFTADPGVEKKTGFLDFTVGKVSGNMAVFDDIMNTTVTNDTTHTFIKKRTSYADIDITQYLHSDFDFEKKSAYGLITFSKDPYINEPFGFEREASCANITFSDDPYIGSETRPVQQTDWEIATSRRKRRRKKKSLEVKITKTDEQITRDMLTEALEQIGISLIGRYVTDEELGRTVKGGEPLIGGGIDSPDLDFIYDDSDIHTNEIAELYSYTEQPELALNVKAFEDQMEQYNLLPSWQRLSLEQRKSVVMKLLDQLEVSSKPLRMRAARCILYIAQGCWAEMQSDAEQQQWGRVNVMLLYQLGVFSAFTDLLNIEIENSTAAHVAMRKIAVSLADSQDLRVILSVLYTITEVIRNEKDSGSTEYENNVEAFCTDLANSTDEELLIVKLLGMVTRFCSGAAPHFPMKKVLLLLWKLILVSLGGMTVLKELKDQKRAKEGLPSLDEDTMEIAKTMRASSPPASACDLLEAQNQKRTTRPFRRQNLMKQSSLDDHESLNMELDPSPVSGDNGDDLSELSEFDERRPTEASDSNQMYSNYQNTPTSPPLEGSIVQPRGLPWKPKVRQKDIDMFLDTSRTKFVGYSLQDDRDSLAGLPLPIHEGVKTLKEHVYVSLAELQIQKEEEIARNPLSTPEDEIEMTATEILYQAMLPNLPQYMIALLKILLAAAPTSKAKTDSINIMADVLPEEMPMTVLQSMKLGIDLNRHKEIIVKAVSAILLLLLKHFKLNHIYQFEFMSQHLVFANCIPLVLKFFNQNIMAYVGAKNVIPILDFPSCVIGDQPELTSESLQIGDAAPFSWRNMFSCINLLRILNKLTKWKHSRIMMLVVFKSAPILKRTLKVRHAMTQLYVLKLLKMQTKYLGRQWRKSNMKTISAIYQKVRHRLNDDWAYGNDLDARPWDFQAEECALRASVDRFNNRRYTQANQDSEFLPVDNSLNSVLGTTYDLSDSFKQHYQLWLEQEVYENTIQWEELL